MVGTIPHSSPTRENTECSSTPYGVLETASQLQGEVLAPNSASRSPLEIRHVKNIAVHVPLHAICIARLATMITHDPARLMPASAVAVDVAVAVAGAVSSNRHVRKQQPVVVFSRHSCGERAVGVRELQIVSTMQAMLSLRRLTSTFFVADCTRLTPSSR